MLELNTCCLIGMMLWVKEEASKCLSDTNSESSPALPCPFHSSVCASVTGWPGGVLHFFIMLHPESTSPEANSLLTICFSLSLSLFLLCMRYLLWTPYSPYTFILKGAFLLFLLRDHSLPKTLIFLTLSFVLVLLEVSSLSESTSKETASMHALKQRKAQPQTSHLLPFQSHPHQQVARTSTVSRL